MSVSGFLLSPIISTSYVSVTSSNLSGRFPSAFLMHRNYPNNNASARVPITNKSSNEILSKNDLKKRKTSGSNISSTSLNGVIKNSASLSKQNSSNAIVSLRVLYLWFFGLHFF